MKYREQVEIPIQPVESPVICTPLAELFQLPAPDIQVDATDTRVILFAHQKLSDMDRKDEMRACYQRCSDILLFQTA